MRHYNIAIFVPHKGCPHDCAFCNQKRITGQAEAPTAAEVRVSILDSLSTFREEDRFVEIAFFGGSFTAMPMEYQEELLKVAYEFVMSGEVQGIRLSTRPDAISREILAMNKKYGVTCIELGVQSMDADVLIASNRGHTTEDVYLAAKLIHEYEIDLGVQMMTGLPIDSFENDIHTAMKLVELEPICARIYPTLVIRDTTLCDMYEAGEYAPQSLEDAVEICSRLHSIFKERNIKVIRLGLMATDEIQEGRSVVAGPCHPSFGELVYSKIYFERLISIAAEMDKVGADEIVIGVHPSDVSMAIGNRRRNVIELSQTFGKSVKIVGDGNVAVADIR